MAIPSAEDVESYNITELISFLREQNLGLAQEYLDKIENERINGKVFRLLTRQDLRNELKFPLGETLLIEDLIKKLKLKGQEEVSDGLDEALSRDFESIAKISEISIATSSGTGASTLSHLCKHGVIQEGDRLYYRGVFEPPGGTHFTISQLFRVVDIDKDGNMMVMVTQDNVKKTSEAFSSLKALEGWIFDLNEVDEVRSETKEIYKRFFLMRPLGTLYDLKNH